MNATSLQKVRNGDIDPSFVITHRAGLKAGPALYKTFRDKEDGCIKVVMRPHGRPFCPMARLCCPAVCMLKRRELKMAKDKPVSTNPVGNLYHNRYRNA